MIRDIFILHHTHVDIGYTGDRAEVCDQLVAMVDQVIDLVAAARRRPAPERFRWIHEVSWPVIEYLRRGGRRKKALFEQLRSGLVELTALYVNPTDLFDHDTLNLSIDYACELARRERLPLTTAMFSDCPGIAWSIADILYERGIRYLSTAPDFIMSMPLDLERPFWWEGPEGGRVLVWFSDWRNKWYAEGLSVLKLTGDPAVATERLFAYVKGLQNEGYRWDGLAVHVAMDNVPPAPALSDFVRHFNRCQSLVKARMATNTDFFTYMERRHGREFTVHRGAWPDWWANGNAAAAYETACSRRAKASLRRSKALHRHLKTKTDPDRLHSAHEALFMFDEHTWGASTSVSAPWAVPARKQWAEKRLLAVAALLHSRCLESDLLRRIPGNEDVLIVNPFEIDFTGPVLLRNKNLKTPGAALRDIDTGEVVPGQRVCSRTTAGDAGNCFSLGVPKHARRRFQLVRQVQARQQPGARLENDFYRIVVDSNTGAVTNIRDKQLRRNLVDAKAAWSFAELIHERAQSGSRATMYDVALGLTNPDSKRPRPAFVRTVGHMHQRRPRFLAGPVFDALLTKGRLPGVAFIREVRLYHAVCRIDVLLRLCKAVNTDYESLYLAWPFAGKRHEVWIENAGAVYRTGIEQLPGSATDWHSVGEYVAVTGGTHTAVLAPHDVPLVQVGDINTGKWQRRLKTRNGHVYSWIMNNMWFTNFPAYQEGAATFAWSITTHADGFDGVQAAAFAHSARVGLCVAEREKNIAVS